MHKKYLLKYWIYTICFGLSQILISPTSFAQPAENPTTTTPTPVTETTPARQIQQLPNDLRPDFIPNIVGNTAEDKIYNFTGNLIITIMQIVGGIAIVLIIYNGFKYTISRGEESDIEQSKTNLFWIVGGLILLMISYIVIRFVVKLTLSIDEFN